MKKTIEFKDKPLLDLLNYNELMDYRRDILRNDCEDWKTYIEELELYMDIRFKDVVIEKFEEYRNKLKNPDIEKWDRSAMELILSLQPDSGSLYTFFTYGKFKLLKPFKYINIIYGEK